ncbi:MAG TPA: hypothetical protein VLC47_03470 [Burkholderiales bacterium]|nr:hypothetical protein [Burkholderiales bacterium]
MALKPFLAALAAVCAIGTAHAQSATIQTDWATFGKLLSVVHVLMQASEKSGGDPKAMEKAMDDILNGRNAEANALALEIFGEVPAPEREKMLSIGRSMATLSQRQATAEARASGDAAAIQARKDLTAIGLVYHDKNQFLDAVKRNDLLAARLFIAGRGVDPNARDLLGASALDIAKRGGNAEMIALLADATRK